MVGLNHPAGIPQDEVLVLHHAIRWEAALTFASTHRTATGVEADAELPRGADLIVNPGVIGVDVEMIGDGGRAGEEQLRQSQLRAHVDRFAVQPRPDGIQRLEPVEEHGVLRGGHGAGERLVEVVVRVDQARQHNHPAGVEDTIRCGWQFSRGANRLDDVIADEQPAGADAAALVI